MDKKLDYGYGVRTTCGIWHLNSAKIFTQLKLPLETGDWMQFGTKRNALYAGRKYAPSEYIRSNLVAVKLS